MSGHEDYEFESSDDFGAELKTRGLKNTRHRAAILGLLRRQKQPADADQLYAALLDTGITVNLSTVYRTLDTLCAAGLVSRLVLEGEGKALYESKGAVHRHHLICLGCKKIMTIEYCPLSGYEETLADATGYEITGHKLDMYGFCPECRHRKKN